MRHSSVERRPVDNGGNGREPQFSEDDLARSDAGSTDDRQQTDRMTPQRRKKTPTPNDPGHTA